MTLKRVEFKRKTQCRVANCQLVRFAVLTVAAQHSLFDGKARIGKRFRPCPGRQCVPKAKDIRPHIPQPTLF